MRGVNRVILVGNATRDAELHQTESGKQVANMRLATNRTVKTAAGETEERTQYHTVVCFDRLAEQIARYVKKGRALYVEGRLEYREYTDTEGAKRHVTEIIASADRVL
jgi:single-strand DNA-binding protein